MRLEIKTQHVIREEWNCWVCFHCCPAKRHENHITEW